MGLAELPSKLARICHAPPKERKEKLQRLARQKALTAAAWAFVPVGCFLAAVAHILQPVFSLRIFYLKSVRIGHQISDLEVYLRQKAMGLQPKGFDLFITEKPANRALARMIERHVPIIESTILTEAYWKVKRLFKESDRIMRLPPFVLPYKEFNEASAQLKFSENELSEGKTLLRAMGVAETARFICFHVRDSGYLQTAPNQGVTNFSYHDYRDCRIENYLPAAEALANAGLYAVRLGKGVDRPLLAKNPRIIDYATKFQTDLADIFLAAHCKFFLGTTSGLINVSWCFDVPTAAANLAPLGVAPMHAYDIFIPKKYRDKATGRMIKFSEIIKRGADRWFDATQFREAGIEVLENSADEVLQLALEMNARIDKTWVPSAEDDELQARYKALFDTSHPIHGFPSRVGAHFLRTNRQLLD